MYSSITAREDAAPDRDTEIAICVVTYRRPRELGLLLDALRLLEVPDKCRMQVVVVDNDPQGSAFDVVQDRAGAGGDNAWRRYVREDRRGVSAARTRAVNEALAAGADYVGFLDDDEIPVRTWLTSLYDKARESGADLVGGPMLCRQPDAPMTRWQKFLMIGLSHHTWQKVWKDRLRARRGDLPTIITNNWFARASFLRESGMRFDDRYSLSGGEDTDFFLRFVDSGGRGAWCHEALVTEQPTIDRLSLKYQFLRSREKSLVHFVQKKERGEVRSSKAVRAIAALRIAVGAAMLLVLFPVPWAVVSGTRSVAWGFGRLDGLGGVESNFFAHAR